MTPDELASVRSFDKIMVGVTSTAVLIVAGLTVAAITWGPDGVGEVGFFLGIPATIIFGVAAAKAWYGDVGDLGDKKTVWAEGPIGLSDRLDWTSRSRDYKLWFADESIDVWEDVYDDLKALVIDPTPKGHRPTFLGAVQYVPASGLLLRVRDSKGAVIYERPGLLALDGTGRVKGGSPLRLLLLIAGAIAAGGLLSLLRAPHHR